MELVKTDYLKKQEKLEQDFLQSLEKMSEEFYVTINRIFIALSEHETSLDSLFKKTAKYGYGPRNKKELHSYLQKLSEWPSTITPTYSLKLHHYNLKIVLNQLPIYAHYLKLHFENPADTSEELYKNMTEYFEFLFLLVDEYIESLPEYVQIEA